MTRRREQIRGIRRWTELTCGSGEEVKQRRSWLVNTYFFCLWDLSWVREEIIRVRHRRRRTEMVEIDREQCLCCEMMKNKDGGNKFWKQRREGGRKNCRWMERKRSVRIREKEKKREKKLKHLIRSFNCILRFRGWSGWFVLIGL